MHVVFKIIKAIIITPFKVAWWVLRKLGLSLRWVGQRLKKPLRTTRGIIAVGAGVVVLMVLPVVLWQLWSPFDEAKAAWFDQNYLYRQQVTLSGISTNQTDIQVLVTIDTSALIANGRMQSDCDDMRFTDINGSPLPYWIESGSNTCNTTTTNVWIRAPQVLTNANGRTILYFYYGNPSATIGSNGEATFVFFDDFSGSSLSGKWRATGATSVSGGELTITTGSVYTNSTIAATNQNLVYEMRAKWSPTIEGYAGLNLANAASTENSNTGSNRLAYLTTNGAANLEQKMFGADGAAASYNIVSNITLFTATANTYYYQSIAYSPTTLSFISNRGLNSGFATTAAYAPYMYLGYFTGSASGTTNITDMTVDFVIVRKYVQTLPTAALGSQQVGPGPLSYWKFDEAQGSTAFDSASAANNGTITGATWTQQSECISATCLRFDGSGDSVTTAATITPSTGLTVGMWVRPSSTGIVQVFAAKYEAVNASMQLIGNNTNIIFRIHQNKDVDFIGRVASGVLEANTWQYITATWDGSTSSSGIRIYKNGIRVDTSNSQQGSFTGINPNAITTTLGAQGMANVANGYMDEVIMYPYARTAQEVLTDYNISGAAILGNQPQKPLSEGLIGYWKLDETGISDASDSSGNNWGMANNGSVQRGVGKFYNAGIFGGTGYFYTNAPDVSGLQTISFWVNPASANDTFIGINATTYINSTGGVISANGMTSPKIYVNGVLTNALPTSSWSLVTVTTTTPMTTSSGAFNFGRTPGPVFSANGTLLDEIRVYNRELSPAEVFDLANFAPNPAGYWKLDDNTGTSTVIDSSGNGFTGTLNGSMTQSDWVNGKYGSALDFDGVNDYIGVTSSGVLNLPYAMSEVTFSAWVKLRSCDSSGSKIIEKASGSESLTLECNSSNLPVFARWSSSGNAVATGTTALNDNQWHHVAGVLRGRTTYIYVDGRLQGSNTNGSDWGGPLGSGNYRMGASVDGPNREVDGIMDELRVYNYARTTTQIQQDLGAFQLPSITGGVLPPLIAYWPLNEMKGTVANDVSGNGNNLTLSTAAWTADGKVLGAWDGDNGRRMSRADDPDFNFAGSDDFSINLWMKSDSTTTPFFAQCIVCKTNLITIPGYAIYANSNGTVSFAIDDDSTWNPDDVVTSPTNLYDTSWHHISARKTGTSRIDLFVDGTLVASKTNLVATGSLSNNSALYISDAIGSGVGQQFVGDLDEIKFYRAALSTEQVNADMGAGAPVNFGATAPTEASTGVNGAGNTPVILWNLDENTGTSVANTSGLNSINGSFTSTPLWVPGKFGSGLQFDGTDDMVTSTSQTALNLTSSAFTIQGWVKTTQASLTTPIMIRNYVNPNGSPYVLGGLVLNVTAGKVSFDTWAFATNRITGTTTVTDGQWHFISAVYSGGSGGTAYLYVDGKLEASGVQTGTPTSSARYLRLGANICDASLNGCQFLNGSLDQVMVYNYARSPAQVAYDYNRGGPVNSWQFDECQGTLVHDSSTFSNNGTITVGGSGAVTNVGNCATPGTVWGNGAAGKYNASLYFDGTDDYVTFSNAPFTGTTPFSVFTWIKTSATGTRQEIIDFGTGSTNQMVFFFVNSSNQVQLDLFGVGGPTSAATVTDGNWHQVGVVYSGATMQLYIDGVRSGSAVSMSPNIGNGGGNIGVHSYGAVNGIFNGNIDDVRIYNYALSQTQIKQLFNQAASIRFGPLTGGQ